MSARGARASFEDDEKCESLDEPVMRGLFHRQNTDPAMIPDLEQRPFTELELQSMIEDIVRDVVPSGFEYNQTKVDEYVLQINEKIGRLLNRNYIYNILVFMSDSSKTGISKTCRVPDDRHDLQKIVRVTHSSTASTVVVIQSIWFGSVGLNLEQG